MTKPLVRFVLLLIAALTLLSLLVPLARAEKPKLTLGTQCGAAGVGKVWDETAKVWRVEPREAAPMQKVKRKGRWVACDLPPDCPAKPAEPWGPGLKCVPPTGATIGSKMVGGISVTGSGPSHPLNRQWWICKATPAGPQWQVHREVCK